MAPTPSHSLPAQHAATVIAPSGSATGGHLEQLSGAARRILGAFTWAPSWSGLAMQLGAAALAFIGILALAGWLGGSRTLASGADGFIPVAPNTAVVFLLFSLSLWTLAGESSAGALVARVGAAAALVIAGARLAEYLAGIDLGVDRWLFSFPAETLGLAPVGKMAFFTALNFIFAGSAVLMATGRGSRRAGGDAARALGILTTAVGAIFVLGYLYGSPLLYGGRAIPMALPTAIGFMVLGLSLTGPLMMRAAIERRQAERALRAAHNELEQRVTERTAELESSNEELQIMVLDLEEQTAEADRAHRETAAAEARYRSLVDGLDVGVMLVTVDGIQAANPAAERILGVPIIELRGRRSIAALVRTVREDGSPFEEQALPVAMTFSTGKCQRDVLVGVSRPDGSLSWILVGSDPLFEDGEPSPYAVVASFIDVTEERRLREQLMQAQKMEAVGQLAGGVAHDFNNLLTAIMSYAQLALEQLPQRSPVAEDLQEIRAASERAAALTRQLLAFSRKQILQPRSLDLNNVVEGVGKMLSRLIGEDIEYRTRLTRDLWSVRADPGQVEQVITNLVVNARDAMPNGGRIMIETSNVSIDGELPGQTSAVEAGEYVLLSVTDTGCGMDRQTQARIFEPFYTTKEAGRGTGLGLSTVYGIVKQSGGHVAVYSEPGHGATFRVYLPRERETGDSPALADESTLAGGSETILVVEDDPAVRVVSVRMLEKLGYRVLTAPNAAAAIAIVTQHSGTIHLLLTDLVLPQTSGRELAKELVGTRQDMRVLFMSGYTEDAVMRRGIVSQDMQFLSKPFALSELAVAVRRALART